MTKNYIKIENSRLNFAFEELGLGEELSITFHRTLRIPDDNKQYGLPPSLGAFPLEHVEDYAKNLPESWAERSGVFFPMYQAEAMWLSFSSHSGRPYAIKVAAGKINAVSGKAWSNELEGEVKPEAKEKIQPAVYRRPTLPALKDNSVKPDYMVAPTQPWLDGFNVGKDSIRQFVAMPLDSGYTVEEQITGKAEHGGVQIIVYPMKEELWQKILKERQAQGRSRGIGGGLECMAMASPMAASSKALRKSAVAKPDMGLGAGGLMKQEIYEDEYGLDAWDTTQPLRVFVHLANSEQYKEITGKTPPTQPPSAKVYSEYNFPWFDYYSDAPVLPGSEILAKVDSIASQQVKKQEEVLPDDGIGHELKKKPGVKVIKPSSSW